MFDCRQAGPTEYYLYADTRVQCTIPYYALVAFPAAMVVVAMCVACPALVAYLMAWKQETRASERLWERFKLTDHSFRYLHGEYRQSTYFFGLLEIARKLFLTVFLAELMRGRPEQFLIAMFVNACGCFGAILMQPFLFPQLNLLYVMHMLAQLVSLSFGYYLKVYQPQSATQLFLGDMMFVAWNATVPFLAMVLIAKSSRNVQVCAWCGATLRGAHKMVHLISSSPLCL